MAASARSRVVRSTSTFCPGSIPRGARGRDRLRAALASSWLAFVATACLSPSASTTLVPTDGVDGGGANGAPSGGSQGGGGSVSPTTAADAGRGGADAGAQGPGGGGTDASPTVPDAGAVAVDPVQAVFDAVSGDEIKKQLEALSGTTPVTVNGQTLTLSNRYTPQAKASWRAYFESYFQGLGFGANVRELAYPTAHRIGETSGHNVEAVLPGKSPDSIVVIVHYDSIGPGGLEASNPGVDDDMTGMAALLEAARVLSKHELAKTVRFVASDYEEQDQPLLEGAREYAKYLQGQAKSAGFSVVAAIDYEQSGWNCLTDQGCSAAEGGKLFGAYYAACDGTGYNFKQMFDDFQSFVGAQPGAGVTIGSSGCPPGLSDLVAMWEIGVPAIVTSEYGMNPHFDKTGGDTIDRIDFTYLTAISRLAIAYTAKLAGVGPAR